MTQQTPYLLAGSGDGPYEIQQGDKAVALLRNTTFGVATHIVYCLNTQPELLAIAKRAVATKDEMELESILGEFEDAIAKVSKGS